jgi:NAD(P)-dependent dehydrogenase (short-subunit alcohol dehydrogenase family)
MRQAEAMPRTRQRRTLAQMPDQTGRTVLVTGANHGLGFAGRARLGRHRGLGDPGRPGRYEGPTRIRVIRAAAPNAALSCRVVDLADLDSVRARAATSPPTAWTSMW